MKSTLSGSSSSSYCCSSSPSSATRDILGTGLSSMLRLAELGIVARGGSIPENLAPGTNCSLWVCLCPGKKLLSCCGSPSVYSLACFLLPKLSFSIRIMLFRRRRLVLNRSSRFSSSSSLPIRAISSSCAFYCRRSSRFLSSSARMRTMIISLSRSSSDTLASSC